MKYYPVNTSDISFVHLDALPNEKAFLESLEGFNICREFYDMAHILEAGFKDYDLLFEAELLPTAHRIEARFELKNWSVYTLSKETIGVPQSFYLREDHHKGKGIILDPTSFFPEVDQNYLEKVMKYIKYWMENGRSI